jgi:glycine/D-amino acid oxidase-like deaminating enzyme
LSSRCLVVGAGVVGAATAFRLAEAGAEVELIDAAGPGAGTSGTTFAWVGASPRGLWEYFELNVAGMAAYRRLRAELGPVGWYRSAGSLAWHSDPEAEAGLVDRVAELREAGYPAALIGRESARRLEPDLRFGASVEQVAFYPDEGYASPRPMIADLLGLARERGVTTRWNARVVGLEDGPAVVLATGERLQADVVVLCCGRWSGEVAGLAGLELPMIAGDEAGSLAIGLLVLTSPGVQRVRRVLDADELMIRPDGAGRLLLHSDEHDRKVEPGAPPDAISGIAADVVEAAFAHLEVVQIPQVERAVVGIRALTGDLLPAVGWLPGADGVYVAVTHSGVTLAPVLGELIAAEVLDGTDERLLRTFRPARFATPTVSRAAGEAVPR